MAGNWCKRSSWPLAEEDGLSRVGCGGGGICHKPSPRVRMPVQKPPRESAPRPTPAASPDSPPPAPPTGLCSSPPDWETRHERLRLKLPAGEGFGLAEEAAVQSIAEESVGGGAAEAAAAAGVAAVAAASEGWGAPLR